MFSRKRMGLAEVGEKARARVARAGMAIARERSFVLRTCVVGKVKEGEEVTY